MGRGPGPWAHRARSDIEQVVIGAENGVPIFLRQVAAVKSAMPSGPVPW